jgi:hypothetical protein
MRFGWAALGHLEAFEAPGEFHGSTGDQRPQAVCSFDAGAPGADTIADLLPDSVPHPAIGRHPAAFADLPHHPENATVEDCGASRKTQAKQSL